MLLVDVILLLLQVEIYISPLDDNAKTLEKKKKILFSNADFNRFKIVLSN